MKYIILITSLCLPSIPHAKNYVYINGTTVISDSAVEGKTICVEEKEYIVQKQGADLNTGTINIERKGSWNKIGVIGKCSGIGIINASKVLLPEQSLENIELLKRGATEYNNSTLPDTYDKNLDKFYKEIQERKNNPEFSAITRKWPLSNDTYLLEQCFKVVVTTDSYPSMGKIPITLAEKYMKKIINRVSKTIFESKLTYIRSYSESDVPRYNPCINLIDKIEDIDGDGKYEYKVTKEQPEGAMYEIYGYTGKDISLIHKLCTGEVAVPYGSLQCP